MSSTAVYISVLLVLSTYFSVVEPLDAYEDTTYTPKEKSTVRSQQTYWFTPRPGKRVAKPPTIWETIGSPEDRDEYKIRFSREGRGDINDIIYKFPPFAPRPGRSFCDPPVSRLNIEASE